MRRLPPAWFLFFFAPLMAEYVSGSSPYLNPFVIMGNLLLYGGGTLLIRELRVRWGKGWLAVFILAVAYMIAEEGLMLNTLFDPTRNATGRALGVNWVWTTGMLMVHSLVSIFTPILLAEAIYERHADESWIKPRTCWWLLAAFTANVFGLGHLIAPANRPGLATYLVEAAVIAVCLWLAKNAPTTRVASATGLEHSRYSPESLYFRSLAGMTVTMVIGFAAPTLEIPVVVKILVMLGVYLAFIGMLRRDGAFRAGLDPLSKLAVAGGMISFWIATSPLKSLAVRNIGPVFFGVLVAVFLLHARRRIG